ncbi:MAG: hypothetical protein JNM70_03975 [Anaerolineae bacterium]|nr:hypothetical protein [Anaerolineae bacterium]
MMGAHQIHMNHPSTNRGSNPVPLIALFALIIVAFAVFISAALLTSQRTETPTAQPLPAAASLRNDAAFMSGFIVLFGLGGVVASSLFWAVRGQLYNRSQRVLQAQDMMEHLKRKAEYAASAEVYRHAQAYAAVQVDQQRQYMNYAKERSRRRHSA